jgi:hypothetical protein
MEQALRLVIQQLNHLLGLAVVVKFSQPQELLQYLLVLQQSRLLF